MATSWIIEDTNTGKPVAEVWSLPRGVLKARYRLWTAHAWLVEVNRRVRASCLSVQTVA